MSHVNVIASILNDDDNKAELAAFRSMSAPPSVVEEDAIHSPSLPDEEKDDTFRQDPAYYTYYYNQRLLNPRLPPPVVSWKNYSAKDAQKLEAPQAIHKQAKESSWVDVAGKKNQQKQQQQQQQVQAQQQRLSSVSSVVDRIQQDFPRTPSPVYTLQQNSLNGATSTAPQGGKANNGQHLFNQQPKMQQGAQMQQQQQQPRLGRAPMSPQQRALYQEEALASQMQNLNLQDDVGPQGNFGGMQKQPQQLPNPAMMQRVPMQQQYVQMGAQNPQIILQQPDVMPHFGYYNMSYPANVFPQFVAPTGQMSPLLVNYPQQVKDNRGMQQKMYINQQPIANPQQMYAEPEYFANQQAWDPMAQQAPVPNYGPAPVMKPEPKQRRNNKAANNNNNSSTNNNNANNSKQNEADFQPRSKLMEEFKGGKGRKWELKDIVGHVKEFSRDQYGSRFIQQKLETASAKEKELIFEEIYPHALELMTDVFGNYVIQKFFEFGASEQKKSLAKVLKGHVMALTLQTYGCRVIQKALEVIDEEDKSIIAEELNGHVMRCVQDQNGNHVIQKCIEKVPPKMIQFIVDSFVGNVSSQAVHAYGCRVIQRILEFCSEKQAKPVLDEILTNAAKLVKDQYGNYVVQHVLERGLPKHKTLIIKQLKGQLVPLSQNKFASNVVEKCYENGAKRDKQEILDELMPKTKDPNISPLFQMMKDQYANYVIQKIIELSDDSMRRQIVDYIKPHIAIVRRFTFAKHILACLEKFSNEKF